MLTLLDYEKKTAKNLIIKTLSERWPLSTKKIYSAMKRRYQVGFTYQAVHFALQEFLKQGILVSQNRQYMLNPEWVGKISSFTADLADKYSKEGKISTPKQLEEMNFNSLAEAFNFALSNLETGFFGTSRILYAQVKRLLPFPVSASQIEKLKKFCSSNEAVILCQGDSLQDKVAAKFLKKIGVKVYLGVPCAQPANTLIFSDSVITIYTLYSPKELLRFDKAKAEKSYTISEAIDKNFLGKCFSFVTKKLKVKLVINRNPNVRDYVLWATKKLIPKEGR